MNDPNANLRFHEGMQKFEHNLEAAQRAQEHSRHAQSIGSKSLVDWKVLGLLALIVGLVATIVFVVYQFVPLGV